MRTATPSGAGFAAINARVLGQVAPDLLFESSPAHAHVAHTPSSVEGLGKQTSLSTGASVVRTRTVCVRTMWLIHNDQLIWHFTNELLVVRSPEGNEIGFRGAPAE